MDRSHTPAPSRVRHPLVAVQRGFSLTEAVMTLAIVGVLTSLAVPSLRDVTRNSRMTTEVNAFMAILNAARSEAVKRGQRVRFCPSRDGRSCAGADSDYTWWHEGAILFVDSNNNIQLDDGETLVRVLQGIGGELTIKTSPARRSVSYLPNGFSTGTNLTFAFCDPRGAAAIRYVFVSNTGRPRIAREGDTDLSCP